MNEHVVSVRTYATIFIALLMLTGLTVGVSTIDLGELNTVAALTIAVCKGTLVVLFFMHLRYSTRLTWLVVTTGLLWLMVLIAFVMSDVLTRGWLGVPGH